MQYRYSGIVVFIIGLGLCLWVYWNRRGRGVIEFGAAGGSRTPSEINAAQRPDDVWPESPNWQTGLTPQQVNEGLSLRVARQGGPLQVWKNKLQASRIEAETIRDIKVTPEIGAFFDKVEKHLNEKGPMIDTRGAQITSVLEAKEALVDFGKLYSFSIPGKAALHNGIVFFAPQAIAKLARSRIHPNGGEIKVPDNFSKGWAIKFSEKNRIILYKWDFNEAPPKDGILGIETEFK